MNLYAVIFCGRQCNLDLTLSSSCSACPSHVISSAPRTRNASSKIDIDWKADGQGGEITIGCWSGVRSDRVKSGRAPIPSERHRFRVAPAHEQSRAWLRHCCCSLTLHRLRIWLATRHLHWLLLAVVTLPLAALRAGRVHATTDSAKWWKPSVAAPCRLNDFTLTGVWRPCPHLRQLRPRPSLRQQGLQGQRRQNLKPSSSPYIHVKVVADFLQSYSIRHIRILPGKYHVESPHAALALVCNGAFPLAANRAANLACELAANLDRLFNATSDFSGNS